MFLLQILTPSCYGFQGEAEQLTVRTETGELTVLSDHMPYCAAVCKGKGRMVKKGREVPFTNEEGVLSVQKDKTVLMIRDVRFATLSDECFDTDAVSSKRKE